MSTPYRLLIVDDDARLAASLRRTLSYAGYEVAVAGDGPSALTLTAEQTPALIVLDVMLPGLDGLAVCRRLRRDGDTPILMLTARDTTADRVAGLDSGADDYLVKPFAPEELLARVRALLRRHAPRPEPVRRWGDLVLDSDTREVTRAGRPLTLTALEFNLLRYLLQHARLVRTRDQIIAAVWGDDSETISNVVDVYVGYLRQKLEAAGEPRLLQTVRGVGYVLREP